MDMRTWWKHVEPEHKLVMLILLMGMALLVCLVLFSGCIATTGYVQMEDERHDKIAEKSTWDAIGQTEAERLRLDPENKSALNVQMFALKKRNEVIVPPSTPASFGWGKLIALAGTVMTALGIGTGVKIRSMGKGMAERDEHLKRQHAALRGVVSAARTRDAVADPQALLAAEQELNGGV